VRKSKGNERRDTRDKLILSVPITANPFLADLLDYYIRQRAALFAKYFSCPPLLAV
jgi:hypothetical protein